MSENIAKERRKIFESYQSFILPSSITRHYRVVEQVNLGVSSGKVIGILVDMHSIESFPRPRILLTESLSPDLYQYFDQIDGIISSNG